MFRRFRLASSFQNLCQSFRFVSSTASYNQSRNKALPELLGSTVLQAAEYLQHEKSDTALHDQVEKMIIKDFILQFASASGISAIENFKSSLKPALLSALFQTITKESSKQLVPGHVHRHTAVLPYGILARNESLHLITYFFENAGRSRGLESIEVKENRPLAILIAPPYHDDTVEVALVLNITFNSSWPLKANKKQYTLEEASNEVATRLIAAAQGFFIQRDYTTSSAIDFGAVVRFCSPKLNEVITQLRNRLRELFDREPCLIVLLDEVSELAGRVVKFEGQNETINSSASFYSEVASMVSPYCAVMVSGFSVEGSDYVSQSGRTIYDCTLPPLNNAHLRRSVSPMITLYFQRLASVFSMTPFTDTNQLVLHPFKSAVFYFELMKSSPGLFGTVLEKMAYTASPRQGSVHTLLMEVPEIALLDESFYVAASNVLQWKSIQFCPFEPDATTERKAAAGPFGLVPKKCFLAMFNDCNDANRNKHVYVGERKIGWLPMTAETYTFSKNHTLKQHVHAETSATKVPSPITFTEEEMEYQEWRKINLRDQRKTAALPSLGIEPTILFMKQVEQVNQWFDCFRMMLLNFSLAFYVLAFAPSPQELVENNSNNNDDTQMAQFLSEFSRFGIEPTYSSQSSCLEFLKRMIELRFQVKEFSLDSNVKIKEKEVDTYFAPTSLDATAYLRQTRKLTACTALSGVRIYLRHAVRRQDTTLHVYFFEDATAVGICAQKELRFAVSQRMPSHQTALNCSVNRFLAGSPISLASSPSFFYDEATRIFSQLENHDISIRWIDRNLKPQQAPIQFVGHFPHQGADAQVLTISGDFPAVVASPLSNARHFTRDVILVPARPENNPLVDIIFHENLASDDDGKQQNQGVVQFWVDVKHRHSRFSSENQRPEKFVDNVVHALQNPLFHNSSVKHVVHIIVTTNAADDRDDRREAMKNVFRDHKFFKYPTNSSSSSCSPSYSLYIIHPDSFAFENLVSQPIARAMPLTDQQLMESWRQRIGVFPDWKTFKATTNDVLGGVQMVTQGFAADD